MCRKNAKNIDGYRIGIDFAFVGSRIYESFRSFTNFRNSYDACLGFYELLPFTLVLPKDFPSLQMGKR